MSTQKNILIIGKSPAALEAMGSLLRQKGYKVETTNNFDDIPGRFKLEDFDLITMGGQVPPDTKTYIIKAASACKSNMLFVQGMAAIPGLVVNQIEGELRADRRDPTQTPVFHADTRTLSLPLADTAAVNITAWWQTTFVPPNPGSDSKVLIDERLDAGKHSVSIPDVVPDKASFASVQIGEAIYCFSLV